MLYTLKKQIARYISLGLQKNDTETQKKRIKLLHVFCNVWHVLTLLTFIEDYYFENQRALLTLSICAIMFLVTLSVQLLQYYRRFLMARILFIFNIIILTFIFSNYTYKGELLEYYFLFPPAISLIFIDSKKMNLLVLAISYLCLFIPNLYLEHYPIPIFNDMNVSFLFFGIFIMVNYFKNLNIKNESALKQKTLELENINEFQSQFFINISHEIRTPITLLKGYIETLKNYDEFGIRAIEDGMTGQVQKITKMVDDVLDLAKMESSNFKLKQKPINISLLLDKIPLNFGPLFKQKDIQFNIEKNKKLYFTMGDSILLERAINNIIINAVKYTDRKGKISVALKRKSETLIITIKDTGIGISEKDKKKVFDKFYQANNDINKASGSGIGLAFCKEIIEQHNGNITVKNNLKQGVCFTITLPMKDNVKEQVLLKELTSKKTDKITLLQNNSIVLKGVFLVVDDQIEMRNYIKSLLYPCFCLEAENGLEALKIIEKEKIDCIITDYMMPKMNGLEFVQTLNKKQIKIPIIMLTARGSTKSKLDVLRLGIDDYLQKPFEKEEFLIRIKNILKNQKSKTEYLKSQKETVTTYENSTDWLLLIKNYVYQKCASSNFCQDSIAHHFSISKSSFYRKIKSETGLTPNEFINEVKLLKAYEFLKNNPDTSLKKLSMEVGFLHTTYFSKLFYKRFGFFPHKPNV